MLLNFTIMPVFTRDLVAAAREREGRRLHSERSSFAVIIAAFVLGTFGAWFYWSDGYVTHRTIARSVNEAASACLLVHFGIFGSILVRGAWPIAAERNRGTLDFLLATPMTNTEIVLGKLASCLVMTCASMAGGLPVVLLLHALGGIDLRVIALGYACFASTILFLSSLAIWISVEARDIRLASVAYLLAAMTWVVGPFSVWVFLPRFGIHMPEWVAATNGWLILSSPISVGFLLATGLNSWVQLSDMVGRMIVLQLLGAVFLTVGAIARLRSVHRTMASGDQRARGRQRRRPIWRFRRRPPVGDDPILWREMYTTRGNGTMKAAGVLVNLGLLAGLAYATYAFARPAVVEVWRHGYGSGVTSNAPPEFNLFVRMFLPDRRVNQPLDLARTEFNLFLRYVTFAITLFLTFIPTLNATETIAVERRKETWNSLLATPMTARAILQSALLATVWRIRQPIAIVGVLWTMGLLAGAIHPLGYLLAMLNLAAWVWLFIVWGLAASVLARDRAAVNNHSFSIAFLTLLFLALPFLLPARFNSVLLGAGSNLFVGWMSLVSYRDVRAALHYAAYPPLEWIGIATGEGPLWALATCFLGIVAPVVGGWWVWRYTIAHFDRLVGRPWRSPAAAGHTGGGNWCQFNLLRAEQTRSPTLFSGAAFLLLVAGAVGSVSLMLCAGHRNDSRICLWLIKAVAAVVILSVLGITDLLGLLLLDHNSDTTLPTPTGPLAVGLTTYVWSDAAHSDPMAPKPDTKRELLAWISYPAAPRDSSQTMADYLPVSWRIAVEHQRGALINQLLTRDLSRVRTHSIRDAEVSLQQRSYPVVPMPAGLAGLVTGYTCLAEDLASHGYVVVGFDAPYRSSVVVFPDGAAIARAPENNADLLSGLQQEQLATRLVQAWSADMGFALDQLERLNASDPSGRFLGRLDIDRVGVFGHSLGGATALQFCHDDSRCKAGIDVDGAPLSSVLRDGVTQPFMFLLSDHQSESDVETREVEANIRSIFDRLPSDRRLWIMIRGANHFGFSDDGAMLKSPLLIQKLRQDVVAIRRALRKADGI
jgi:ABC-type Na+ efflux pump permease subunit/dienelactone hydrolase